MDVVYSLGQFTGLTQGASPQAGQLYQDLSSDPLVAAIFSHIKIEGDDVTVVLTASPDVAQSALIDIIVASHDGLGTQEDRSPSDQISDVVIQTANGRDFSAFLSDTEAHVAARSNPHQTSMSDLPEFDLAAINDRLQGGDLDLSTAPRDPNSHASSHELGGTDEIALQTLSSGGQPEGLIPRTNQSGGFDLVPIVGAQQVPIISAYNQSAGSDFSTNGFDGIVLDSTSHINLNYFSLNTNSGQITILISGLYSIDAYASFEQVSTSTRTVGLFRVVKNGVPIEGMLGYTYSHRASIGEGNAATKQGMLLAQGDVIQLQGTVEDSAGDNAALRPIASACGLFIRLEEGLQGPQGPQGIPGTGSSVLLYADGNFEGSYTDINLLNATVEDAGGGQADVQINTPPMVRFFGRNESPLSFTGYGARDRVTLTQTLQPGIYEVKAYCETFSSSGSAEWIVSLLLNGDTIAQQQVEPEDTDDRIQFCTFDEFEVTSPAEHTLILRIQQRDGGGVLSIRRARVSIQMIA